MKTELTISPDWLAQKAVQRLFDVLEADGGEARIVGGAVRNFLMNAGASDLDFATTLVPEVVMQRLQDAGIKAIPTGIDHGTVTALLESQSFEITTLRRDIETDGRHAVVMFGTDFKADANRRDFTVNALYVDRAGVVYDYVDGLKDIEPKVLRFIGDAGARIEEDYLRILRFFRFFAYYGQHRPDAEGLKACARLKDGMITLSAERIWNEMAKIFAAPDPSRALLWMRQIGVLTLLLPESEKWGIDAINPLIEAERKHDWQADGLMRLMAIIPPRLDTVNEIAKRWKMSNVERDRLRAWSALSQQLPKDDKMLRALAYRHSKSAVMDGLHVQSAMQRDDKLAEHAAVLAAWDMPELPVRGADLLELGYDKGPTLGAALKSLEKLWVESDFQMTREALLKQL